MYCPQKSKAVTIISLLSIVIGIVVIIGWAFNLPGLQTIFPQYVSMEFNAALLFILLGATLLLTQFPAKKYNTLFIIVLSSLVALAGILSLSQDIFHFNAGIDHLFITDMDAIADKYPFPGRMAGNVSACFALFGLAFLGFNTKNNHIHILAQYFLHLITAISAVAILGYLFGLSLFYNLLYVGSMAVHTAVLLFFLSIIASLLHPSLGITNLFTGHLVGNKMARRIYILIIFMVLIFGSFRLQSQRFEIFSFEIGISLLALSFLLVSLGITWHTASWLNRNDLKRYEAEEEIIVMNEELEERVAERSAELLNLLEKFKESESRFRAAFEFSAIGMALVSLEGNWLKVNKRFCDMVGYTEQELLSLSFVDITHSDDIGGGINLIEKVAISESRAYHIEKRYLNKNGAVVWANVNMAAVNDNGGKPLYLVSQIEDITTSKIIEDQLKKSEEKYHSLIEHASDAIYLLDYEGNFTDANESMCKMTGYTKDELLQKNIEELIDPEQLKTDPVIHGPRKLEQPIIRERRLVHKNGLIFSVEINVKMFPDNKVLIIARDITDRKKMEAELRDAEIKFRTLAEKSMVGVYISQKERFIYVNPRFAEIFGYEPHELINTAESAVDLIISDEDRDTVWNNVQARYKGNIDIVNYEVSGKKKDGSLNRIEFYGSRVIINGEPSIIGTMLDITERKRAEEIILREKTLSDSLINSLPEVFYLRNAKGEFLRWNKNFEKITGYSSEEIRKLDSRDQIAEEDRGLIKNAVEKMTNEGQATVEARVVTKDGIKIPFLITITPLVYENQQCTLGIAIDITSRLKAEDELRSSEQKYKLLFESNPQPFSMIAKDDLSIIAVNEAFAKQYGYTRDELLNMKATAFRPKEDLGHQLESFRKDISSSADLGVIRHIRKNGTSMFVQIIANDIIFEGRSVRLSLNTDITEKLKAEELLQKSEANLKTIMDTTDTAYALFDKGLNVMVFNQMAVKFMNSQYNYTPVKGDKLADYFPKERFPQFKVYAEEVLKGKNISYEINYPQPNGSNYWFYVRLFPITNDKKEIFGLMLALSDISERKNAEENLKAAYKLVQEHINSIQDMAWKQSHLIRSPVANLIGLVALLKEDPVNSELMNFIGNELERLDSVIIDLAGDASNHD